MIDLHLHTTASDGTCTPEVLVRRLRRHGIRTFSVTDHDTTAALGEARALARRYGLEWMPGIEITTVSGGEDVHVLGYAFDESSPALTDFLGAQREDRVGRVREMGRRLEALGLGVDVEAIVADARRHGARAVGRPALADALVRAGHAGSRHEAFERFLARGRPAYVPRRGPDPALAIQVIESAGGIAALAHPGLLQRDGVIGSLAAAGLAALEVYHPAHDRVAQGKYRAVARSLGLQVSGGSDYHGEHLGQRRPLGQTALPRVRYERLLAEARRRGCANVPSRLRRGS